MTLEIEPGSGSMARSSEMIGRVLRGGSPARGVSFEPTMKDFELSADVEEATGRYRIEILTEVPDYAGDYGVNVLAGDEKVLTLAVTVPKGKRQIVRDIELPEGERKD